MRREGVPETTAPGLRRGDSDVADRAEGRAHPGLELKTRADSGTGRREEMSQRKTVSWWEKMTGSVSEARSFRWSADAPGGRRGGTFLTSGSEA